ncbi:hypothetical protein AVEN_268499-1, partial [Araneus ventricosus]
LVLHSENSFYQFVYRRWTEGALSRVSLQSYRTTSEEISFWNSRYSKPALWLIKCTHFPGEAMRVHEWKAAGLVSGFSLLLAEQNWRGLGLSISDSTYLLQEGSGRGG